MEELATKSGGVFRIYVHEGLAPVATEFWGDAAARFATAKAAVAQVRRLAKMNGWPGLTVWHVEQIDGSCLYGFEVKS